MTGPISIVIADDHTLFRDMLRERLEQESDCRVVACVDNAEGAVDVSREHQPNLVLLDIAMPGRSSAFDAARVIRAVSPQSRVVFLSGFVQDGYVQQALAVGASGYLSKTECELDFLSAIRRVAAGGTCYSEEVRRRILIGTAGVSLVDKPVTKAQLLTDREREVLAYIAKGLSKKGIAREMGISDKTVDHHCSNVMTKLDIHDRVQLARFAVREGLVPP